MTVNGILSSKMELICYLLEDASPIIRPAERIRSWMEEPTAEDVKRCLPVLMASSYGWEIILPFGFKARWNGGSSKKDIDVEFSKKSLDGNDTAYEMIQSYFGAGIITFVINVVIKTPKGINLWVSGPPNHFKDGIQAMSGLIESDWMPYSFTMNWKFTRMNEWIKFESGEPFCFFNILRRGLVESCEPKFLSIDANEKIQQEYAIANNKRLLGLAIKDRVKQDKSFAKAGRKYIHQKWYMNGVMPSDDAGKKYSEHQTKSKVRPFVKE